jgi:hypothetical protein
VTDRDVGLSVGVRALVHLSAVLAAGDQEPLDDALVDAAGACEPGEVEEALLQSYLFLGYPTALNALARWRARTGIAPGPPAPGGRAGGPTCAAPSTGGSTRVSGPT